ncbi:DUF2530 domain-containing protein [Agromyces sp. NPDC058484]|uniref:DUF2530 domain-containing protein n=1 Tax=Agromyces sp. NPDC058484 TaxID=3346524 RepID=UPI0036693302
MRFWLSESERRPDPVPARADARKAALAGTAAWVGALVISLVFRAQLDDADLGWLVWAAVVGTVVGVIGLVVVLLRRHRHVRQ